MSKPGPSPRGPARVALLGATGLVGRKVIELASASDAVRIVGIARGEVPLPPGARMEMFIAEPDKWGEVIAALRVRALICALGTTMKRAGGNRQAFGAVDFDLVLASAEAAKAAGVPNMVLVSAAGANARAKSLYLRLKGETEEALARFGFRRFDILRPGLLRGERNDDLRVIERAAIIAAPLLDPLLIGSWRRFRSIDATLVAEAALGLALRRAGGRFIHDNEAIRCAARAWRQAQTMGTAG